MTHPTQPSYQGLADHIVAEIQALKRENAALRTAAKGVCWFDWSHNDSDAVDAIQHLRAVLDGQTVPSDCGGCDALREAAAKLTEALDGGLEPELSGVRLLRSQLRGLLQTRNTNCGGCDKSQCWEPCGDLGKSAAHTRAAPEEASEAVDRALGIDKTTRTLRGLLVEAKGHLEGRTMSQLVYTRERLIEKIGAALETEGHARVGEIGAPSLVSCGVCQNTGKVNGATCHLCNGSCGPGSYCNRWLIMQGSPSHCARCGSDSPYFCKSANPEKPGVCSEKEA